MPTACFCSRLYARSRHGLARRDQRFDISAMSRDDAADFRPRTGRIRDHGRGSARRSQSFVAIAARLDPTRRSRSSPLPTCLAAGELRMSQRAAISLGRRLSQNAPRRSSSTRATRTTTPIRGACSGRPTSATRSSPASSPSTPTATPTKSTAASRRARRDGVRRRTSQPTGKTQTNRRGLARSHAEIASGLRNAERIGRRVPLAARPDRGRVASP
jgi:hypothetical protein